MEFWLAFLLVMLGVGLGWAGLGILPYIGVFFAAYDRYWDERRMEQDLAWLTRAASTTSEQPPQKSS